MFRIVSIAAGVAVLVAVAMNWSDIRRYIKIEQM